jgi:hypothetical protein
VFLTASNQIVNDLRSTPTASSYRKRWQASKLVQPRDDNISRRLRNLMRT